MANSAYLVAAAVAAHPEVQRGGQQPAQLGNRGLLNRAISANKERANQTTALLVVQVAQQQGQLVHQALLRQRGGGGRRSVSAQPLPRRAAAAQGARPCHSLLRFQG